MVWTGPGHEGWFAGFNEGNSPAIVHPSGASSPWLIYPSNGPTKSGALIGADLATGQTLWELDSSQTGVKWIGSPTILQDGPCE